MADKLILDKNDMKNRATAHLRIYVGGLSDDATVDELYNHFIGYGPIDGIILNRVFGFIQFNQESSAQAAIAKANGSIFQGRKINVKPTQQNVHKNEAEVVNIQSKVPPAVALIDITDETPEESEDLYDSYGNFVGDQRYREKEYEERGNMGWERESPREVPRGRGRGIARGRGRARGTPASFREHPEPPARAPEWADRKYERFSKPDYPRSLPVTERNDCEIIVVSKSLTEYAEYIEGRLKRLGIVVDLLFPMEDVPIGKVLGNIASRGCLYAILVMPQNQDHRSLTLTILHGLPQEHRNIPLEDALQLLSRNFQEVQRGGSACREAVYALLGQLADGRTLTVLQYDKVVEYLQEKREQQVKIELGEPLPSATPSNKTQVDLQQRILNILNDKKPVPKPEPPPVLSKEEQQTELLNDPTVKRALESILLKLG